jgi:outer membrane lipoprotein SlyB
MKMMNMNKCVFAIGSAAVLLTGCQNPDGTQNNTGSGALIGGALGAITGAAIGGRNHGGQDALIGAAAGVVAGGLIGYSMDREQEARLKAQAPQTYARVDQGQPLSVADVKALAKAGVTEDVIISQITSSHTVFHLSSADIIDLRDAGVTDKVVNFMINTPNMAEAAPAPAPAPAPAVVVEQAPPPMPTETVVVAPGPDYMWVGGEYVWEGGAWVWVGGHWMVPPHPHAVWVVGRSWHDRYGWHHDRGYWR